MRALSFPALAVLLAIAACSEATPPVAPPPTATVEPEWVAREEAAKRANPSPAETKRASDEPRFNGKTY